jgi:hypothetical protein
VTNNADDFRELVGDVEIHPGLIVIPSLDRPGQLRLFDAALSFIEEQAGSLRSDTAGSDGEPSCRD